MYDGFNASEHWAKNFINRNTLRSLFLYGEAGSVDDQAIAAVVRPPPYAEVTEEFSTLEAKARSSGHERRVFSP